MAAQVLHGQGNVTYTNSTGQNVRVVINYLAVNTANSTIQITANGSSWGQDITFDAVYGKTIGYRQGSTANFVGENASTHGNHPISKGVPLEFALDNGGTFTITSTTTSFNTYNIIIIPEAG